MISNKEIRFIERNGRYYLKQEYLDEYVEALEKKNNE